MSEVNQSVNKEIDEATSEVTDEQQLEQAQATEVDADEVSSEALATLRQDLAKAQAEAQENLDKFQRARADLDNTQKRAVRDVENAHKYALDKFIPELLAVKDSLEMGVKSAEKAEQGDIEKFIEGSEMTIKIFNDTLNKFGVVAISPDGETFNPDLHQAITMLENNDFAANTVIDVIQKGYTLNDRLVRPAMVIVSKKSG